MHLVRFRISRQEYDAFELVASGLETEETGMQLKCFGLVDRSCGYFSRSPRNSFRMARAG
jgi:hypothetical protein